MISRRNALMSTLFGAGYVGLRALATGLPAAFLLDPRRALADQPSPCPGTSSAAQFIILSTSGNGDPINANVPGTLAFIGSPLPDVLRMMNCAALLAPGQGAGTWASARRGSRRNAAGSPVASARRPT